MDDFSLVISVFSVIIITLFAIVIYLIYLDKHKKVLKDSDSFIKLYATPVLVFFSILLLFSAPLYLFYFLNNKNLNINETGQIGDTIGGLWNPFIAFFAALLTFAAFFIQYQANQDVRKQFQIQQFENRFFELIKFHKENVSNMRFERKDNPTIGVKYFYDLTNGYLSLKKRVQALFESLDVEIEEIDIIKITYEIAFNGVYEKSEKYIYVNLGKFNICPIIIKSFINSIYYRNDPQKKINLIAHSLNLAHYFRNLYNIIIYVDEHEYLSSKQKKEYIKILRTQFNQYELAVILVNSLQNDWHERWKNLICEYQLLKNLPEDIIEINVQKYYPCTVMEWED